MYLPCFTHGDPVHAVPRIVIYDGVCAFCSGAVRFIIRRDPQARYRFASMQSAWAREQIRQLGLHPDALDTLLLFKQGRWHVASDAALGIAADLSGWWPLCGLCRFIPRVIRDGVYGWFARRRLRLFASIEVCPMMDETIRWRWDTAELDRTVAKGDSSFQQ